MKPELIRFSSRPCPFRVDVIRCANLECPCTEVAFKFREMVKKSKDAEPAILFQVRVDGLTWEEIDPPSRSPEIARLVQEFLRDYPPSEREVIKRGSQEKAQVARRLKEYRIDPKWIEDGTLVSFGEILYQRRDGKVDGASFLDEFEHAGEKYFVDDLYCPNPHCDCREVHLAFVRRMPPRQSGANAAAEYWFRATLSLDGRAEVAERHHGTADEAKTVLSAWQTYYGDDLEELQWRYEKVKEIARRSVPRRTEVALRHEFPADELAPAAVRIGRNDPCPCGSGKKFKRCCWNKRDISSRPR